MARAKKQEEAAHSESWLVSYCDMISLLVTFFLMMMTFSTSASGDVKEVGVGLLKGRGGMWKNKIPSPAQSEVDFVQAERLAREVSRALYPNKGEQPYTVGNIMDGFIIGFDTQCSFGPGSDEVTRELRDKLVAIGRVLSRFKFQIVVEGYTDNLFKPTRYFPDETAMGYARAREAALILIDDCRIAPDRVQLASHGSLRPRAPNDTSAGRRSNRRVELRVLPGGKRLSRQMQPDPLEER